MAEPQRTVKSRRKSLGCFPLKYSVLQFLGGCKTWEMLPSGFLHYCDCYANVSPMTGWQCVITNQLADWGFHVQFCLECHLFALMAAYLVFSPLWGKCTALNRVFNNKGNMCPSPALLTHVCRPPGSYQRQRTLMGLLGGCVRLKTKPGDMFKMQTSWQRNQGSGWP